MNRQAEQEQAQSRQSVPVEKALRLDKGDVLIARTDQYLTDHAIDSVKGQLEKRFPGNRVLVLSGGLDIGFMKREHLQSLRDGIDRVLEIKN